jgi:hypothetical protein
VHTVVENGAIPDERSGMAVNIGAGFHIPARHPINHPQAMNIPGTTPQQAVIGVIHRMHRPYYYCGYLSLISSQKNAPGEHLVHKPPDPFGGGLVTRID